MTTTAINTEDLRDQLQAATKRQQELGHEARTIDSQIQEASKLAARQRADAARYGESVSTAAADMDVEHLRRRKDELPFELWAARITTAQLARDLHQAELEEAEAENQKAGEEFAAAQREALEAERSRDSAYARSSSAGQRVFNLRGQLREDVRTLQRLEGEAPGA